MSISSPEQKQGTFDQKAAATLRRMIVDGSLKPKEKITEVGVATLLNVSRTPARLALRTLEVEGFIKKRQGRGFTVIGIELGEISKAYEVRGVLEGLAAKLLAQEGMSPKTENTLDAAISLTAQILNTDGNKRKNIESYQQGNTQFHNTIMESCGNNFVGFAYERLENLPLLKLGVLVFNKDKVDQEMLRLSIGHTQHVIIYDAIKRGDAARAEAMMREHSNATVLYSDLFA